MLKCDALIFAHAWQAYGTDAIKQINFPFVSFKRAGISYQQQWQLDLLLANIYIAIVYNLACTMKTPLVLPLMVFLVGALLFVFVFAAWRAYGVSDQGQSVLRLP